MEIRQPRFNRSWICLLKLDLRKSNFHDVYTMSSLLWFSISQKSEISGLFGSTLKSPIDKNYRILMTEDLGYYQFSLRY